MSNARTAPVLKGRNVVLRPPRVDDVDAFLGVERDPDIHRLFGGSRDEFTQATRADVSSWLERLARSSTAWVMALGARPVGEIRLDRVDLRDRRAALAAGILDRSVLGQGFGTEAIRLVVGHAFGTLGLHRLTIRVLAYNERALRAYGKCGFRIEGRERESALVDGEWHDDVMLGLLDREYLPPSETA